MLANENSVKTIEQKDIMIQNISTKFNEILRYMDFDVDNDQQIKDTPTRWARMMVNELCSGCYNPPPKVTVFDNTKKYDQMVFLGPIELKSLCSHHFKSFLGNAFLAYIPGDKVIGISKLSRIVKWFMKRPQIQEELSKQIADYIEDTLKPKGCAVYIEATHLCLVARGIEEKQDAKMITSDLRGNFREQSTKTEFLNMIDKVK